MSWQQPIQILAIKRRVRRRDGNRCVVCEIDQAIHEKWYGRILEVHRIEPGSDYSTDWGVCVTLCRVCHDALHGVGHWGWIAKDDPTDERQLAAWRPRLSERWSETSRDSYDSSQRVACCSGSPWGRFSFIPRGLPSLSLHTVSSHATRFTGRRT